MKTPLMLAVAASLTLPTLPVMAQTRDNQTTWETGGKTYNSLAECQRAKKRAKARGAVAGAVIAGAGAAILGGNVGETALVAGAGALAGREIGRATAKKC
jgi:uncharacterized membrane protein YebE (DUF533 family)